MALIKRNFSKPTVKFVSVLIIVNQIKFYIAILAIPAFIWRVMVSHLFLYKINIFAKDALITKNSKQ